MRCLPRGLASSLHAGTGSSALGRYYTPSGCGCQFLGLALIIIYVFSRNITYDHCLKYWSNYVLQIKRLYKTNGYLGGTKISFSRDEFCVTIIPPLPPSLTSSCYKHGSVVLDELYTYIVICGFIETCLSRMFSRPVLLKWSECVNVSGGSLAGELKLFSFLLDSWETSLRSRTLCPSSRRGSLGQWCACLPCSGNFASATPWGRRLILV